MQIELATVEDAPAILALQRAAYQAVGERYDDFTIPPLTEDLEETEDQLDLQTTLKLCVGGRIVGSVRAYENQSVCHVGRLIVDPDFQGQGIGTALLLAIEGYFPEVEAFELFTGHKCERSIRLYEHLEYKEVGRETITEKLTHVIMRKEHAVRHQG